MPAKTRFGSDWLLAQAQQKKLDKTLHAGWMLCEDRRLLRLERAEIKGGGVGVESSWKNSGERACGAAADRPRLDACLWNGSSAIKSEGLLGNQSSKALHSLKVENKDVSGGSEVQRRRDGWTGNLAAPPHRRLSSCSRAVRGLSCALPSPTFALNQLESKQ